MTYPFSIFTRMTKDYIYKNNFLERDVPLNSKPMRGDIVGSLGTSTNQRAYNVHMLIRNVEKKRSNDNQIYTFRNSMINSETI